MDNLLSSPPSAQDILKTQGTRLSDVNPWDSYADEMTERLDPRLEAAVNDYAQRRYEEESASNQNREELCRQKETNQDIASEYQWLSPDEYADHGARIGAPMTHAEFIHKLRGLKLVCWYTQHPHPDKATLWVSKGHGTQPPEVACWVQTGFMPELSFMNFDEHGAPLAEKRRGWRTPLLQLIMKGHVTEEDANRTFGRPKQTAAYSRYNATLQAYRNAGSSLGE